jgi:tetratricopeptide (TPR) repeat protein
MADNTPTDEMALIGEQAGDGRLSPAELHDLVRQRLDGLATVWSLRPADTHRLTRRMHSHVYAPGEMILPRGVHADCLGLVVRGQVAVHLGGRGTARLGVVLLPGSTFGELMLLEGRPSGSTLQALTRCEIRFLRRVDLEAIRSKRRTERWAATLRRLVTGSMVLLAVLWVIALLLSLPFTRQATALVPMSIGQWCHESGYQSCAEQAWQIATHLAPTDPNPFLALGAFYFERGEVGAAEQAFEAARAAAPDSPEAHNNLGLLRAQQGEHEEAIVAFRRALELEPGIAATEHNLALSLQASGAHDEALVHYQSALALGEPQTSTLVSMAIAYYEAGQAAKAAEVAQQALLLDEALAPAHTVLGAVALESRQPEEALPSLRRAVALDASSSQTHFYLGLAYKSLNQPAEAIVAFERALATADDEAKRVRIRRHLDELYEAEGESILP